MSSPFNVEIEYRKPIKGGHMLKVRFNDLGMYIDGWTLRAAANSPSGWWFQPPFRNYNGTYIKMVEFAKGEFIDWLQSEAIRVVEQQTGSTAEDAAPKGLDEVSEVPDEMLQGDESTRNAFLSDAIDQTMLATGDEPRKQPPVDPWRVT